ncbi:flagellar motor protein MotS [Halobacillus karajensis]|uniref:Chemotaxis protein MotB n=1 Tax=Halobacillus karajensis TaxID=195088 RepID=A0A024P8N1_9BACI|nr:flagellar motor protein MotS [Halobacillus karajensis]CDQ18323.1 Chemotaxis protein MotB [Halobacillus karajensis]CDQ24677.1 Chemotaxis protein MotB [Halobacillus karajensis]CDQ29077.1 Chemotaxis protein MotB [Halobacillus karajensis]
MKLRPRKVKRKGSPKWMTTYADMITLVLVFFILLFSMSQINLVKFEAIAESFRNRMIFDFYPSAVENDYPTEQTKIQENGKKNNEFESPTENPDHLAADMDEKDAAEDLDKLKEEVDEYLKENDLSDIISATQSDRGVVLVLEEQLLFETSRAEILDGAKPFLTKVGTLLENIPNFVKVEGHTDNRQINTYRYPSNWELSGARASSVVRYLINLTERLDPKRLTAVAYGETRPVVPNDSEKNWSKNRRVEIVILDPEYNSSDAKEST